MPAAPVAEPPSQAPEIAAPPVPDIAPSRTPPSKPPGPTPPSSAPSSDDDLMADSFGDLEAISKPKPAPAKLPVKPDETKPKADFESEEAEKPSEPQKTPEAKAKSKMGTFRDTYDKLKLRNAELEQQVKQIQQGKPTEDPRLKTYIERLEAAEKRREELESEIRHSAYERSDDYKREFQKPFDEAYHWGRNSTAKLKVIQEDGSTRQATPEDFDKIALLDDEEAADLAEKMFGNKDKIVMAYRWELKKLDANRWRAIENNKNQGTERQQKVAETEAKDREYKGQLWGQLNQVAAERFPQWFKPEDGDADGNSLLEAGYSLADSAFSGGSGRGVEETVRLHASIRNRAAAFTREVYRNSKLKEQLAEKDKIIAEYEASVPGPGEGGGPKAATSEFEELKADA